MRLTRIASGVAALALGGAGLALTLTAPAAEQRPAAPIEAEGTAREVSLACPPDFEKTMGASTAGIGGEDSDTLLRTRTIVAGGGEAELADEGLGSDGLRTAYESGAFPGELSVQPGEGPVLAAATTQRLQETGELAGMALTPCVAPGTTQHLVGGSTAASSSAQLVLTNVSGSPATVEVAAYTSTGAAGPSVISSTTVDANSSETLLVEAGVRDARLAMEVTSTGGQIAAHLLVHEVDGIVGSGLESVTAGAEPATTAVVPGADLSGEHGSVDMRVANPGAEPATVSISAVTDQGIEEVPGASDVAIAPGTVLDLSMDGLQGQWSALIVESDFPILAGARIDIEGDYAWLSSIEPASRSAASVPDSISQITLYAEEPTSAEMTFYDHTGTEIDSRSVTIDVIASLEAPDDSSFVLIDAESPIHAGILSTRDLGSITGISGLSPTAPPAASSDLLLSVVN